MAGQRSQRIGSGISAIATQLKYFQILVTPLDHDLPFLVTLSFFDIERSNSVRCNCSCTAPHCCFGPGKVWSGLFSCCFPFSHSSIPWLIFHSCNRAILEEIMLSGHFFNPARSCKYVIPQRVLVNLATHELDPRSSHSLDQPQGCSHTSCCSKPKPQHS